MIHENTGAEEKAADQVKMQERIVAAGFGGQGIVLLGKVLAYAGLLEGKNVTCLPSYGPEMRGGTANCMITISTCRVGSPYIAKPTSLIAMNPPSLDRFEPQVEAGGCILLNASLIKRKVNRNDASIASIEANHIAEKLGDVRVANMVALGAFVKARPVVAVETVIKALGKVMPTGKKAMISLNEEAIRNGADSMSMEAALRAE